MVARPFVVVSLIILGVLQSTFEQNFSQEKPGSTPVSFIPVVGNWSIADQADGRALIFDGTSWAKGQAVSNSADVVHMVYGSNYAEFLDNVKAYAYFPFAIYRDLDDFHDGEIALRFKPLAGKIDQAAGIIFNLQPNGDYLI